jgi:nicotinamidase-related amidase
MKVLRVPYKMIAAPMQAEKLQTGKTAIILLDFQKYTCDRSTGLATRINEKGIKPEFDEYYRMVDEAQKNCINLLEVCRQRDVKPIFCYLFDSGKRNQYSRQFEVSQYPLPTGDLSEEYLDGLIPAKDDEVITRDYYSPFLNTGLEEKLRAEGIDTLILAGTLYNYTVSQTAREAADRGFTVIVVWDSSAGETLDWHMVTKTGIMGSLILSRRTYEVVEMVEGNRT